MPLVYRRRILYWSVFSILVLVTLFIGMASVTPVRSDNGPTPDYTRFATPLSSPEHNGGNATWTVTKMTFTSMFPKGFDFVLDVTSSAGRITIAKVRWRHSTSQPVEMNVLIDTSGELHAHWATTFMQTVPQWVGVDYWWVLTDEQGNSFETPHGYAEYADNTRKWRRLVSDDAVIHWEASLPAELGQDVANALKERRDVYQLAWGKLLNYKPQIIIYASVDAWKEWDPSIVSNTFLEGETSPYWGSTVQFYHPEVPDAVKRLAYGVVLHEMEHLYQQTYNTYDTWHRQVWFYEGDASYMEVHPFYDYLAKAKQMAAAGELPELRKEPALRLDDRLAYDIGYSYWKYIEATFGPDMHQKVWAEIAQGLTIEDSLRLATGQDFPTLEDGFRKWLGAAPLTTGQ